MGGSPWRHLGLWRLTRSRPVRRAYAWARAQGVFLAQLDRFERRVDRRKPPAGDEPPPGVDVTLAPATEWLPAALSEAPVAPADSVVRARRDGTTLGYCVCSDRPVYVPELDRRRSPPGIYCWRLFVAPAARGLGVGTALVAAVLALARSRDVGTVSALVAPDNVPSRRLFRGLAFRPTVRYTSGGLGDRRWHRERRLGTE